MSDQQEIIATTEFSRPFRLLELIDDPEHNAEISATEAEREALAARYSVLSLDKLDAQLTVRRDAAGDIVVEGSLQAKLTQECVVTLEPVHDQVSTSFDQRFTLYPSAPTGDFEMGPDDVEPPEPIIGDSVDLGEVVAQHLSLAINPYPRALDADEQAAQILPKTPEDSPFSVLASLRERDRG